ncbi:MAG: hypothetical protein AAF581_16965 [Planctomycetota bacterium]
MFVLGKLRFPAAVVVLCVLSLLAIAGAGLAAPPVDPPEFTSSEAPPRSGDGKPAYVRERSFYIPFERLEDVFERHGRGIFLPYEEFLQLWNRAHTNEPEEPDTPPAPAVVRGGNYQGTVSGDLARFQVQFTVESLVKGWTTIPFPLAGVAVESVQLSDTRALLAPERSGYSLLLPEPGTYEIQVQFAATISREPGKKQIRFQLPAAAVSRMELTIPESGVRVDVQPALAATQTISDDGNTRVLAFLGNSQQVQVAWSPPPGQSTDGGAIVASEQAVRVALEERILRVDTAIEYTVQRGELAAFEIEKPADMQIIKVDGKNLRQWLETEDGKLRFELHEPVRDRYSLYLRFERPLPETPPTLTVPFPKTLGVLRETGWVTLGYGNGLQVRITETTGLSQLDPDEVPEALREPGYLGFVYLAHPLAISLQIEKITPEVRAEVVSVLSVGDEEDRWVGWIDYQIRRAGLFRLSFEIPSGWEVEEVGDTQRVEQFRTTDAGPVRTVAVSLRSQAINAFRLPFRLVRDGTAAAGEQTFTPPRVLDVEQDQGLLGVSAPRSIEVITAGRDNVLDSDADEILRSGIMGQVGADAGLPRAFRYRRHPASVTLSFTPKKTEVEVLAQHLVEVTDGELRMTHLLDYNVLYAPVEAIQFVAPTSLDDRLQVAAKQKTQVKRLSSNAGATLWEVRFQPPLLGPRTITITHAAEIPALDSGTPVPFTVPVIRANGVRIEQGFVAIRKEGTLEVAPTATEMEPIDAVDLPDKLRRGQIYSAFRYFSAEPQMELQLTRFDYERLATTAVPLLRLRGLLTEERRLSAQAVFFVQNSERQYLELRFPQDTRILSLLVNGAPQSTKKRAQSNSRLIEIPTSATAGGTFPIVIDYEQPLGSGALGSFGTVQIQTPELLDDVPVGKTELDIFLPPEFAYISWGGNLRRRAAGSVGLWSRFRSLLGNETHAATRPEMRSDARFPQLQAIRFDLPTDDHELVQCDTLSAPGKVRFRYISWPLYWFIDFLLFLGAVVATIVIWMRVPKEQRVVGVALFLFFAATLTWFTSPPASGLASALTAGVVVVATALVLRAGRTSWRKRRRNKRALAPDPYLEEAPASALTALSGPAEVGQSSAPKPAGGDSSPSDPNDEDNTQSGREQDSSEEEK